MTVKAIVIGLMGVGLLALSVGVCQHLNGSTEELLIGAVATVVTVPLVIWAVIKVVKS